MIGHCETGKSWAVPTLRLLERRHDPRSASLLASLDSSDIPIQDISIDPSGISANTLKSNTINNGISEIGSSYRAVNNFSIREVGSLQTSMSNGSFLHSYTRQIGGSKIGIDQRGESQIDTFQIGSFQIGSIKDSFSKIGIAQNNINEIDTSQLSTLKINPTEIPLSSSVTLQQFLSSHNFNLQNTTIPTWTEFLAGTTPFNLNIEILDRPTGQLAEANITRFDPTVRPTSGTLTLDTDGRPISSLTQTDSLLNHQNSGQLYRTTATDLPDSDDRPHPR
jgi:hypothetical protein